MHTILLCQIGTKILIFCKKKTFSFFSIGIFLHYTHARTHTHATATSYYISLCFRKQTITLMLEKKARTAPSLSVMLNSQVGLVVGDKNHRIIDRLSTLSFLLLDIFSSLFLLSPLCFPQIKIPRNFLYSPETQKNLILHSPPFFWWELDLHRWLNVYVERWQKEIYDFNIAFQMKISTMKNLCSEMIVEWNNEHSVFIKEPFCLNDSEEVIKKRILQKMNFLLPS